MRQKVNAAVAEVRAEVDEGRLKWCFNAIRRLIRAYPPHQDVDTILEALGEDTALENGEKPYEATDQGSDAGAASDQSQWSDAEDYREQDWSASVEALPAEQVPTVSDNEELDDTSATISAESAELATKSTMRIDTYAAVAEELRRVGAVALAANAIREQRKEARRMRKVSELAIGVLVALSHTRDAKAAAERKRMGLLAELRLNRQSLSTTKDALEDANAQLRVQKRRLFETEQALDPPQS